MEAFTIDSVGRLATRNSHRIHMYLVYRTMRHIEEEGKLGPYAMKRIAAGAHLSTSWLLERATVEPTTAWAAVFSPNGSTMYSFLQMSGLGCAL